MPASLVPYLPFLFPLYFAAIWLGVCWILSRVGWNRMREFQSLIKPAGRAFHFSSADIAGCRYNGALTFVVAPEGLWMQPVLPFRAFHAPLLLPWTAFKTPVERKIWFGTEIEFQIVAPSSLQTKIVFASPPLRDAIKQNLSRPMPRAALDSQDSPFD